MTITERVFAALNVKPDATIEELQRGDKRSTVTAARYFWRSTRHKTYVGSSSVANPVEVARRVILQATRRGLNEAEGRDLAIDVGVAHGTAFAVAAQVYRDFRRQQPSLKGSRGTWTVTTESGLEMPVCHNLRVDWSQKPPFYSDKFKKAGKKYDRWLSAFACGYAVIQKGKLDGGVETRARDSYLGIYRIDQLTVKSDPAGGTVDVSFRMVEEMKGVPDAATASGALQTDGDAARAELRQALLRIALGAERTTKQSGLERTTITKWKEFCFETPDAMTDHLMELYARQQGRCALSGVQMSLDPGDWYVSPDRIDSAGDYHRDNIQLVARCVNFMKGATPNQLFLAQLKKIKEVASSDG